MIGQQKTAINKLEERVSSTSFSKQTAIEEQEEMEKNMNPERMKKHIDYAQRVGASRVYLWGVEWWYFMKEMHGVNAYVDMVAEL